MIAIVALVALLSAPRAVEAHGDEAHGDPTAPGNLTAVIVEGKGVVLKWDAPSEDLESVTGYQILRRLPRQGEPWPTVFVADSGSTATTYIDRSAIAAGEQYNYQVKALRGELKSDVSNLTEVILPQTEAEPSGEDTPAWTEEQLAPQGLNAEAGARFVRLRWDVREGDAKSVTGYEILRRRVNRGETDPKTLVSDSGDKDTSFVDSAANEEGVYYEYWVRALRGADASRLSNVSAAVGRAEATLSPGPEFARGPIARRIAANSQVGSCGIEGIYEGEDIDDDENPSGLLLPDLVSCPTEHSVAEVVTAPDGTELFALRFGGFVTNLGDGPLDIKGNPQLTDVADLTSHDVWQRALTVDGDWVELTRPPIKFERADGHNHFHLMGIVGYSLWDASGKVEIRSGAKVGFCLVDILSLPDLHPNPGPKRYSESDNNWCKAGRPRAKNLHMGISEGWQDIYSWVAPFQWIDVSDISPGYYRVGQSADPDNIIIESDETNNGVALSRRLHVVPGYVAKPETIRVEPGSAVRFRLSADEYFNGPGWDPYPGVARAFRIVTPPSHGDLDVGHTDTVEWGATRQVFTDEWVTYTPEPGFVGVDSFTFVALDELRPDFPISPVVAEVTFDVSGLDATVTIDNAPASIETGSRFDFDSTVNGGIGNVTWSIDGIQGGSEASGTIDLDGRYSAPAAQPLSGAVTVRAASTRSPASYAEAEVAVVVASSADPEEPAEILRLSVEDGSATEGSAVEFLVRLSGESADVVTVQYSTSDGTATGDISAADGQDYTPASGRTLTFDTGETTKTVRIPTGDDTVEEDHETFTLTLSSPSGNAELGTDSSATGTILNDDRAELSDATIRELTLTDVRGGAIVPTPAFDPHVGFYVASVPSFVAAISVAATKSYSGATLEFIGRDHAVETGDKSEVDYSLSVGVNHIEVEVTSANGNVVVTYMVAVTRVASNDATLSSLELSVAGGAAVELIPGFDPAVTEYSVSVGNGVASLTLTTATSHVGGSAVVILPSGSSEPDEATVELSVGNNVLNIVVTAEDGNSEEIYEVSVERAEPEWSSSLIVGTEETVVPVVTGYSKWAVKDAELTPDEFTIDGIVYRVMLLLYLSEGLYFNLDRQLPSDFKLQIGGYEYAGRDSSIGNGLGSGKYWWGDGKFSWTPGEAVKVSLSLEGTALPVLENSPPSAYFSSVPSSHNGVDSFDFRLNFTQPVGITDANLKEHGLLVDGGSVSRVKALGNLSWLISVEPGSRDDIAVSLYDATGCHEPGAICGSGGESLYSHPVFTVLGPAASSDATLASLAIDGAALAETFAPDETLHIAEAVSEVSQVTVHARAAAAGATVSVVPGDLDPFAAGHQVALASESETAISVAVTAPDRVTTQSYYLVVRRASGGAPVPSRQVPTVPPSAPRNLTATITEDGSIALTWDDLRDETVTGYQILRRRPSEGESALLVHVADTGSAVATFTDDNVSAGILHVYRVKAINEAGLSQRSNYVNVTPSAPQESTQNSPSTGLPTIIGTARVGETLTADTFSISDADGMDSVTFSYQWVVSDGGAVLDIQDAAGASYTLLDIDAGLRFKVRVSFSDDAGNTETLTSVATEVIGPREASARP